ncbi:MAG: hypothetical protein HYX92_01485 [Chloroflexi bacterium]|nr:hypothetical protein [Chloroflexota bacterium]
MPEDVPKAEGPEPRDKHGRIRESGLHYLTGEALELQEFEEALEYFREHRDEIISRYEGNYVAILNGEIVDSDQERVRLAERVYKRFGYRHLYMPYAGTDGPPQKRINSPKRIVTR